MATPETARLIRIVFDISLIIIGVFFMVGVFDASPDSFWLPWLLALTGVVIISTGNIASTPAGLAVTGIGLFMVLRASGVITLPWFRYLVGGFLLFLGLINLMRNAKGDDIAPQDLARKSDNQ